MAIRLKPHFSNRIKLLYLACFVDFGLLVLSLALFGLYLVQANISKHSAIRTLPIFLSKKLWITEPILAGITFIQLPGVRPDIQR